MWPCVCVCACVRACVRVCVCVWLAVGVWQTTPRTADDTVTKIAGYVRVHILMNQWFPPVFLAFIVFNLRPICWIYEYACCRLLALTKQCRSAHYRGRQVVYVPCTACKLSRCACWHSVVQPIIFSSGRNKCPSAPPSWTLHRCMQRNVIQVMLGVTLRVR